jgi:hypothetical protein
MNDLTRSRNNDVSGQPNPFSARNGPPDRGIGD